jgi:hypothetical protein
MDDWMSLAATEQKASARYKADDPDFRVAQ